MEIQIQILDINHHSVSILGPVGYISIPWWRLRDEAKSRGAHDATVAAVYAGLLAEARLLADVEGLIRWQVGDELYSSGLYQTRDAAEAALPHLLQEWSSRVGHDYDGAPSWLHPQVQRLDPDQVEEVLRHEGNALRLATDMTAVRRDLAAR